MFKRNDDAQLSRIADALEKIADNQSQVIRMMEAASAKTDSDLSTHASMFTDMKEMIAPVLASAANKMEARQLPKDEPEPALPPQPKVIERNGIRLAAGEPREIEVDYP